MLTLLAYIFISMVIIILIGVFMNLVYWAAYRLDFFPWGILIFGTLMGGGVYVLEMAAR